MATSFILKASKETGFAPLFVRVQRPKAGVNILLSSHIEVDIARWRDASTNATKLKNYRNSERELWNMLDQIRDTLDAASDNGLTSKQAKALIDRIRYGKELAELEAAEEARKKAEEENSFMEYYRSFVESAKAGKERKIGKGRGSALSGRTIINYAQGLSWLEEYQKNKLQGKGIGFQDITQAFFNDYQLYLEGRTLLRGRFKGASGCSHNTVSMRLAELKSVLKRAEKAGMPVRSDYGSIEIIEDEPVDSIALTKDELSALRTVDLSKLPECYTHARDLFLLGVALAQRVSDYNGNKPGEGIQPEDVKTDADGIMYVDIRQRKTKARVQIPANAEAREILAKYGNRLPFVWPQKLNDYIKTVAKMAGITKKERITTHRGGKESEAYIERFKLVSSHTARRTGATLMYLEGIDLYDIMKVTGHTNLDSLKKYVRATGAGIVHRIARYDYFK